MRVFIGFDDTDTPESDFGTGKVARRFEKKLPAGCRLWGVVRQQLLVDDRIPYTSHNSAACVVIDLQDPVMKNDILSLAAQYLETEADAGSDPGLCLASEGDAALAELASFGRLCTARVVLQKEALQAASGVHLSGHGGSDDGIIGAAAAVGLTASGWYGRFIEFAGLRRFPDRVAVSDLERHGIRIASLDRDATVPAPGDIVETSGWLRPRLWGMQAILPVMPREKGIWVSMGKKRKKS